QLVRNNFVGWSGLGPIAMLIENILGFSFDASSNTIRWQIASSCNHGISNLLFNARTVSLLCDKSAAPGRRKISIETSKPVSVLIEIAGCSGIFTKTLDSGKHELYL
ncbi:MAG: hypothetical protein WC071_04910, partial [Victivallaceae bacterium]